MKILPSTHALSLLLSLLIISSVPAAELPQGGEELLKPALIKPYGAGAKFQIVPVSERSFKEAQRIQLDRPADHPWDVGAQSSLPKGLAKEDVGMVVFEARARPFPGESAEKATAEGTIYLQDNTPPDYAKAATLPIRCTSAWQTFYLAFKLDRDLPAATAALSIQLGAKRQILEMGPLKVINYGKKVALKDLPGTVVTYAGRDANAPWRQAALARIEAFRMAPLNLRILDSQKRPAVGAKIGVRQLRNAFGFGSAVTAQWITATDADGEQYRKVVGECFSRVVFENDLKMEFWEQSLTNAPGSGWNWERTQQAAAWLKQQNIPMRGHYLSWAPWEPWSEKLRTTPEKIKERILTHIPRITDAVGDRVFEWDAINHLAGWDKNIDEATGVQFYSEIMKAARAATKHALWVNEDQVFRPGRQQEDYFKRIKLLIADGYKPDGIGNQAHFDSSFLPSPMEMLDNSDRFAALVPALQITEFDVETGGDEELQADYLRDCLLVCYSHPAYTGFLNWGFWEGAHWKPSTALWRKDWSEKPAAKLWRSLVNGTWATKASGKTSDQGDYGVTAHLGLYEISVEFGGKTQTFLAPLTKSSAPFIFTLTP